MFWERVIKFFNPEDLQTVKATESYAHIRAETLALINKLPDEHEHKSRLLKKMKTHYPVKAKNLTKLKKQLVNLNRRVNRMLG